MSFKDIQSWKQQLQKDKIEHERDCVPIITKQTVDQKVWETKYPDHCTTCFGAGGVDDSDPSVGMFGFAPCVCIEAERCPRCGAKNQKLEDEEGNRNEVGCTVCGWNFDDVMPGIDGFYCEHY